MPLRLQRVPSAQPRRRARRARGRPSSSRLSWQGWCSPLTGAEPDRARRPGRPLDLRLELRAAGFRPAGHAADPHAASPVAVALRIGAWNIGAEGQFYAGAFAATGVALFVPGPTPVILPADLRRRRARRADLDPRADACARLCRRQRADHDAAPQFRRGARSSITSRPVRGATASGHALQLDRKVPLRRARILGHRFIGASPIAILLAVVLAAVLTLHPLGLRGAARAAPTRSAARYAGIPVRRHIIAVMLLSGADRRHRRHARGRRHRPSSAGRHLQQFRLSRHHGRGAGARLLRSACIAGGGADGRHPQLRHHPADPGHHHVHRAGDDRADPLLHRDRRRARALPASRARTRRMASPRGRHLMDLLAGILRLRVLAGGVLALARAGRGAARARRRGQSRRRGADGDGRDHRDRDRRRRAQRPILGFLLALAGRPAGSARCLPSPRSSSGPTRCFAGWR